MFYFFGVEIIHERIINQHVGEKMYGVCLNISNNKGHFCIQIQLTMIYHANIGAISTIQQRKALKDFLLSRVTANGAIDRVQLFEERENSSGQEQIDPAVVELRRNKLFGGLVEVNNKLKV